jgi:acyl carrier protein phosphodiesterase
MSIELAREKAAQAWCVSTTQNIVMNPVLAEAFAEIIDEIWSKPWLGNATTMELINELRARIEMSGKSIAEYRPVD